jgi:hypothetical protein
MARAPRNAKRTKMSVYTPSAKKRRTGSRNTMVVLVPTKTRRGKTIYTEVDAAPYYARSDEEGKSPKKKPSKTPEHSTTAIPVSPEDAYQWEGSCPDG